MCSGDSFLIEWSESSITSAGDRNKSRETVEKNKKEKKPKGRRNQTRFNHWKNKKNYPGAGPFIFVEEQEQEEEWNEFDSQPFTTVSDGDN